MAAIHLGSMSKPAIEALVEAAKPANAPDDLFSENAYDLLATGYGLTPRRVEQERDRLADMVRRYTLALVALNTVLAEAAAEQEAA